ncbi:MAG: hypothetical protein JWM05_3117 [Acidimicrobiales bacterium]|nr:hypothetical protein [Acidimicrobiales bacterium]
MPDETAVPTPNPLRCVPPHEVAAAYADRRLDQCSDWELVDHVAGVLAVPRDAPADSFVLHAPLELLARAALLAHVAPADREAARHRLVWLAATYEATGPAAAEPGVPPADPSPARLAAAIEAGDLDATDREARALAAATTAEELGAALADVVVPRLSAAAHGAIFLHLLPRVAPRSAAAARTAIGLLRELARYPDWKLTWIGERAATGPASGSLVECLLRPPSPGPLDTNFIFPTMSLVDRSGLAAELLDGPTRGLDVATARRQLLRVAAWSMLQDDPSQAPYGWTHCLTMPQATLGIADRCADPGTAVAVAATYVLGFRATLGTVALDPAWTPPRPAAGGRPDDPITAAGTMWHAAERDVPTLVTALVGRAATHRDAHLAKYTLACLDAARDDPAAARLFLSAAAFLSAWWQQVPADDDLVETAA